MSHRHFPRRNHILKKTFPPFQRCPAPPLPQKKMIEERVREGGRTLAEMDTCPMRNDMMERPRNKWNSRRKRMQHEFLGSHFRPFRDARLCRGSEPGRLRAIMRRCCVEERGRLLQMPTTLQRLEMILWLPRPQLGTSYTSYLVGA